MSAAFSKSQSDRNLEFRDIADKICEIGSRYSVKMTGYRSPELPLYSALSTQKQQDSLHQMRVFLSTMEATEEAGNRLDNQNCFVWAALSTLGLVPPSDLFSKLDSDALIEIYDLFGLQIWRNFNFMKFCSYTLEEVFCIEWHNRYTRDADKSEECARKIGDLLTGRTPEIYYPGVAEHTIEETCSEERLIFSAHYDLLCTLKNREGGLAAWLVMTSARLLGRGDDLPKNVIRLTPAPLSPEPPSHA